VATGTDRGDGKPTGKDSFGTAPTLKSDGTPGESPLGAFGNSDGGLPPVGAEADSLIGTVINERFKILRRVGKGGMGVVYKARHLTLDTNVAIKVLLHQRGKDDQERFVQEARLASKVRHPNTVYLSDFGVLPDGRLYLVMEFLQGRPLNSELTKGPLELTRALKVAIQMTRGLQAVHDKGIVHRDMKPENVFLLQQDGTSDFVKIVDFGIAKATAAAKDTEEPSEPLNLAELEKALAAEEAGLGATFKKTETRAGQTIGTPPYMSPEQVQSLPVDPRTDQYALC
jgi:serine/threonine-protein kinase